MAIFLNLYEQYTGERHKAIDRNKFYKAEEVLNYIYRNRSKQQLIASLKDIFVDCKNKPTLNYFLTVAPRYFEVEYSLIEG